MPPGIEGGDSANAFFFPSENSFIIRNYYHTIHPLKLRYTDLLKYNTVVGGSWKMKWKCMHTNTIIFQELLIVSVIKMIKTAAIYMGLLLAMLGTLCFVVYLLASLVSTIQNIVKLWCTVRTKKVTNTYKLLFYI